jgi:hypothetical protein
MRTVRLLRGQTSRITQPHGLRITHLGTPLRGCKKLSFLHGLVFVNYLIMLSWLG